MACAGRVSQSVLQDPPCYCQGGKCALRQKFGHLIACVCSFLQGVRVRAIAQEYMHLTTVCASHLQHEHPSAPTQISAPTAQVITCQYDGLTVQIREGPLGDGLGARVWAIAHVLCRELVGTPSSVQGLDVLEIGAGTGICGIVAAKLGARRVVSGCVSRVCVRVFVHWHAHAFLHAPEHACVGMRVLMQLPCTGSMHVCAHTCARA